MNVIYSNGIIIFDLSYEEAELSIKAGELYELAKHNIILLRIVSHESGNEYHYCSQLTQFFGGGSYQFAFGNIYFQAETADDYPTAG